jgi:hypothetical protein
MPAKGWTYPIDLVYRDASGHRYSVRLFTHAITAANFTQHVNWLDQLVYNVGKMTLGNPQAYGMGIRNQTSNLPADGDEKRGAQAWLLSFIGQTSGQPWQLRIPRASMEFVNFAPGGAGDQVITADPGAGNTIHYLKQFLEEACVLPGDPTDHLQLISIRLVP